MAGLGPAIHDLACQKTMDAPEIEASAGQKFLIRSQSVDNGDDANRLTRRLPLRPTVRR
jgi:hypothetical protein